MMALDAKMRPCSFQERCQFGACVGHHRCFSPSAPAAVHRAPPRPLGPQERLRNVIQIAATSRAFAALRADGEVRSCAQLCAWAGCGWSLEAEKEGWLRDGLDMARMKLLWYVKSSMRVESRHLYDCTQLCWVC